MAANPLKKITDNARRIRKRGESWLAAVKRSSKMMKRKKVSGTLSGQGSTAISGTKKRKAKKRKSIVKRVKKLHRAEGKEIAKLGSVTFHTSAAKKVLLHKIEAHEGRKFVAKKKSAKRKISKAITALKQQYRKLS